MITAVANRIAWVGLGANLGQAQQTLIQACQALADTPGVISLQVSPYYRTTPVDSSGPLYVNAVARLATSLEALALLDRLQQIEQDFGRERPYHNAPRTLDLDLLLYDERHIDTPRLTVPHPRMHERAFVLQPLRDLAPTMALAQGTLDQLLARCTDQGISRIPG